MTTQIKCQVSNAYYNYVTKKVVIELVVLELKPLMSQEAQKALEAIATSFKFEEHTREEYKNKVMNFLREKLKIDVKDVKYFDLEIDNYEKIVYVKVNDIIMSIRDDELYELVKRYTEEMSKILTTRLSYWAQFNEHIRKKLLGRETLLIIP